LAKQVETDLAHKQAHVRVGQASSAFSHCQKNVETAHKTLQESVAQVLSATKQDAPIALWQLKHILPKTKQLAAARAEAEKELSDIGEKLKQEVAECRRLEKLSCNVEAQIESISHHIASKIKNQASEEIEDLRCMQHKSAAQLDDTSSFAVLQSTDLKIPLATQPVFKPKAEVQAELATNKNVSLFGESSARVSQLVTQRDMQGVRMQFAYSIDKGAPLQIELIHNAEGALRVAIRTHSERERRQLWQEKRKILEALKEAGYGNAQVHFEYEAGPV
jgi:hypothetical protein